MSHESLDERDTEILKTRRTRRRELDGDPIIGDVLVLADGQQERIAAKWPDRVQPTGGPGPGRFHLNRSGHGSYSGSLQPSIPTERLTLRDGYYCVAFWFFSHDVREAHNGVSARVPVQVWKVSDA